MLASNVSVPAPKLLLDWTALMTLAIAWAVPLAALPPVVLPMTEALPVPAVEVSVLLSVALLLSLTDVPLLVDEVEVLVLPGPGFVICCVGGHGTVFVAPLGGLLSVTVC
jgi:hypothetical protein